MSSFVAQKPHAVCIPFPSQGHVTPMMQLAKLLHSKGFDITFVNTEFNHRRLLRSKGPDALKGLSDFRFETISDGLPPSDRDATQDPPTLAVAVQKNCLAPLGELLKKLNSSANIPQVSCIVSDGLMSFAIQAAMEIGIPEVQFWSASACGLMGYLHYPELIKRGIVPLKDLPDESDISNGYLDTPIDWIPGMKDIRLKDLPSFNRTTDPNNILFDFLGQETQKCLKASAIIINTFDDLEHEVLDAITCKFPHIYTVGPLVLLGQQMPDSESKSIPSSLWKEDFKCLKWLDKMEPNSVVYVNFGSITLMSDQHLREFGWGLANSKCRFLWIVRPDIVRGEAAILPEEFMEETKDRGLLVSWCPQDKVLLHSSIGGFLTHCGWNSMLESLCSGVPMICWPFFAEQHTNCRYACTTWGVGLEINNDVKRDDVESLVKELMEGERGKMMKKKALEWKEKAEEATKQGGSSCNSFDKVIKEVLVGK